MKAIVFFIILITFFGCKTNSSKNISAIKIIKLDTVWLNSFTQNSDSVFTKPYKRTDFVTASSYYNYKDSSVCQVMKDSIGQVRQVQISTKNVLSFSANYYANGQLVENVGFNKFGRKDGIAFNYYPSGRLKSSGYFKDGLYAGEWKNYDSVGVQLETTFYNSNGNIIP